MTTFTLFVRRTTPLRFSSAVGRVRLSSYSPHVYHIPRRTWPRKLAVALGVLGVCAGVGYYFYWPKHTFPPSVASVLRKGLWAESDKGEFDFQLALKYYLAALAECQTQGVSLLLDEYTGIQLKVAEMYERMNMTQNSLSIYSEISAGYMAALTSGAVPEADRAHLIQKDLRVVIKMAELYKGDPGITKAMLMTHLMVAQEEVARRSGPLGKHILHQQGYNTAPDPEAFEVQNGVSRTADGVTGVSAPAGESEIIITNGSETISVYKTPTAWLPFRDELFNARDLFVAVCLSTGDIEMAVRSKLISVEWMILAECAISEILMSTCNLGSLMYLLAQHSESQEAVLRKLQSENRKEFNADDLAEAVKNHAYTLGEAKKCYSSVLASARGLKGSDRDGVLDEAVALATYGLGVISLHSGELDEARLLLRQARLRGKGSGFEALVKEAEQELIKVDNEEAAALSQTRGEVNAV